MGYLFVVEGMANPSIAAAVDSTLVKSKGSVLYGINHPYGKRSSTMSYLGIDTDARWLGYSHTKGRWMFGYKLHIISTTTDDLIVPLTAEM